MFTVPSDNDLKRLTNTALYAYRALHYKVLLAVVVRPGNEYVAYIFPVEGKSHDQEVSTWETDGVKVEESLAKAAMGGACEHLEKLGFRWRR